MFSFTKSCGDIRFYKVFAARLGFDRSGHDTRFYKVSGPVTFALGTIARPCAQPLEIGDAAKTGSISRRLLCSPLSVTRRSPESFGISRNSEVGVSTASRAHDLLPTSCTEDRLCSSHVSLAHKMRLSANSQIPAKTVFGTIPGAIALVCTGGESLCARTPAYTCGTVACDAICVRNIDAPKKWTNLTVGACARSPAQWATGASTC